MPAATVPIHAALDSALTAWERFDRPGLPDRGFTLSRRAGRARRGVYHAATGEPVLEPDEHILSMAPAPDGRHIAVQLAAHADEDAVLALVDVRTTRLRRFPDIRCRYEPVRWSRDSRAVELIARDPNRLVRVDVCDGDVSTEQVAEDARVRLFPGGPHGMLTESRPGEPTRLIDRRSRACLATFPAIIRVLEFGEDVLVHVGRGVRVLASDSGVQRWAWHDPLLQIAALTTTRDAVYLAGVRAGTSRLIVLVEGAVLLDRPVRCAGSAAVATDLTRDGDGEVDVLVEAATLPPRVVPARLLLEPANPQATAHMPSSTRTTMLEVPADDGATLTVAVTAPAGLDGPAPMILTCYGGFGVADLPVFEPTIPAWTESGGRYATAQVRGGGEHGAAWREAGRGRNKHRGVADLACIARGLIDAGLTSPELLVLVGASHGGVLVTSCALGHPGLCAGVVSTAAPLDLLRLGEHPLGPAWSREFGDPDTPAGIAEMRRISPLHRAQAVPEGTALPRFLGIVLDEDSRVSGRATDDVAAVLERKGAHTTVWRAPATGHGSNHLDSLHRLGAVVLSFAAAATESVPPHNESTHHG